MAGWLAQRRDVLAGLALSIGACADGKLKPIPAGQGRLKIGDAHVHLFNAADLPVASFFRFVLAPDHLKDWPDLVLAMIDMALNVVRNRALTASEEMGRMRAPWQAQIASSPAEFAGQVAERAESLIRARGPRLSGERDPANDVSDSYFVLAELLAREARRQTGRSAPAFTEDEASRNAWFGEAAHLDRGALGRIADQGAEVLEHGNPPAQYFALRSPAKIWSLIAWAFRMTHTRSAHVREYLKAIDSDQTDTTLLINLLVDYDQWLGEHPKHGSGQPEQVAFWTSYARAAVRRVRIETFAGYDPLRHAEDSFGTGDTYFKELQTWVLAPPEATHRVSGFKLYPPMGFNVSANSGLPVGAHRAADVVRKRWHDKGWDITELGAKLDSALDTFFDFCGDHDIPMLAHARASNGAFETAEQNADPAYWYKRALKVNETNPSRKLRACLGHYRGDLNANGCIADILKLNLDNKANLYFDIAFDDEIIGNPSNADRLLADIAKLCTDPKAADYFMFGSDCIMLGQIPHADRYLKTLVAAIDSSPFWRGKKAQLLGDNLRHFLKLA